MLELPRTLVKLPQLKDTQYVLYVDENKVFTASKEFELESEYCLDLSSDLISKRTGKVVDDYSPFFEPDDEFCYRMEWLDEERRVYRNTLGLRLLMTLLSHQVRGDDIVKGLRVYGVQGLKFMESFLGGWIITNDTGESITIEESMLYVESIDNGDK